MWTFILNFFGCGDSSSQPKSEKISTEKITEMLTDLHAQGVNTDTTMLWGYFFIANKPNQFDKAKAELTSLKFEFVEIYEAEDKSYIMHLERKEIHSDKSLYELDEQLYRIADKYKITYDGFDVGNVNKDKAIDRDTYVVPEEFKAIDFEKDNFPCLVIGNLAFDIFPHKEEFCYLFKITTTYEKDEKVMLPTKAELAKLDKFEFFIENSLTQNKIKNYYLFRDTHKGIRNFYIATNDKNGAAEVIKQIKKSGKERQFDFEIIPDKTWEIYNEFRKMVTKE